MEIRKWLLRTIITFLCLTNTVGCWNYREVDKLAIVSGVAIDKGTKGKYHITVETIHIQGGRESKTSSQIFSINGKTIFDAVRNIISISGERLYWSHTKVLILSDEIAREGILPILDWFQRDSETRADINILVSKERTAREILEEKNMLQEINSLNLEEILKNEKSLSKAPIIEIWKIINEIETPGVSAVLPVVALKNKSPIIFGTAVFKKDKLIGFLDGKESQALLFAKDQIKGGIIALSNNKEAFSKHVSLEIFKSKSKIKPRVEGDNIAVDINIETTVALDEIFIEKNKISEHGFNKLEEDAETELNKLVEQIIKYVQSEFGVDIFGFGAKTREENPGDWKNLEPVWENRFKDLTVNVISKVHIKGSGMLAEPLEMGD